MRKPWILNQCMTVQMKKAQLGFRRNQNKEAYRIFRWPSQCVSQAGYHNALADTCKTRRDLFTCAGYIKVK